MSLFVIGFTVLNNVLHAVTNLVGTITDATGTPAVAAFDGILIPVRVRKSTTRVLRLEFEQLPIELLGVRTQPSRATLEIAAGSGPGLLRSDLLWAIADAHEDPSATPERLARLLNQLLTPVA